MTAFSECVSVETESMKILMPIFQFNWSDDGHFVVISKGRLAKELQATYGDIITNKNENVYAIDIKAENRYTGNLFLETWSNYEINAGWMHKLRVDRLFYHFLSNNYLYVINFPELQRWAFEDEEIYRFPEKPQRKYSQLNDTRGHIVPIDVLRRELGPKNFRMHDLNNEFLLHGESSCHG